MTINNPIELEALIDSTKVLIEEYGQEISLTRHAWERTPAGGMVPVDPDELDPVRRFFGALVGDSERVIRDEGEQIISQFVLIGLPGDDMQEGDTFQIVDTTYKIVDVDPVSRAWQTKGWTVSRA